MSDTKVEEYYLKRGEEFIDVLFDKGYIREDVDRKELRELDDLAGYFIQSAANRAVNVYKVTRKIEMRKKNEN